MLKTEDIMFCSPQGIESKPVRTASGKEDFVQRKEEANIQTDLEPEELYRQKR
jgi:hypothetical protein